MKKTLMAFALAGAVVAAQPMLACDGHKDAKKTDAKAEQKAEASCCMNKKTKTADAKKSDHCDMKEHKTAAKDDKKSDEKPKADEAKPATDAKS